MARTLPFLLLTLAVVSCRPTAPPPIEVRYEPAANPDQPGRFAVHGLPPAVFGMLEKPTIHDSVLTVRTDTGPGLLGSHGFTDGVLWFHPRFPVAYELPVTATFHPGPLGLDGPDRRLTYTRILPSTPPAEVVAVYPSGDAVPENVLRFYLHFSQPMRRGEVYQRVRIRDPKGQPIDLPFLELDEELWDPTGTRLTLLIDPGRIKRGVKPREDIGTVFAAGGHYTLEVDAGWPDALGRPLKTGFTKTYRVTAPTAARIDPVGWTLTPPHTPDAPLTVRFPRPLDRALLERMLTVHTSTGDEVAGRIEVADAETTWRFLPSRLWAAGSYQLRIGDTLEDPAGNRPDRLFDTSESTPSTLTPPVLVRPFDLRFDN